MGKKELKKQYSEYDMSLIDYLSMIDPSGKSKYLPFLLKQFDKYNAYDEDYYIKKLKYKSRIEYTMISILKDFVGGDHNLDILNQFNQHLENNRIEKTDINEYNSWEDFLTENGKAELKLIDKELTKQIERIYEDSNYLILKPLSFKASLAYGSGTKWCTAMKTEPSYFYRYSREGILIYVIDKIEGKKFGVYSSDEEFSIWNTLDSRIDSMQSGLPFNLLQIIMEKSFIDKNPKNIELFSDEEIKNSSYFGSKAMLQPIFYEEVNVDEPINQEYANLGLATGQFEYIGEATYTEMEDTFEVMEKIAIKQSPISDSEVMGPDISPNVEGWN